MPVYLQTALLLVCSNVFMTFAWYSHLKNLSGKPIYIAILASWGIAFFEYCLQVPANRLGYFGKYSAFQLKIMQEVLSIAVFVVFAVLALGETPRWNHGVAFALLLAAAWFGFLPNGVK